MDVSLMLRVIGRVLAGWMLLVGGTLALAGALPRGEIAFQSDRDGDEDIYRLDVRTGLWVNITRDNPSYDSAPSWSPDGGQIAFASLREASSPRSVSIHIMNADGSGLRRVTQLNSRKPSWSPDGGQIAFTTLAPEFVIVKPVGGGAETALGQGFAPDWSPDGQSIVADATTNGGHVRILGLDGSVRDLLLGSRYFSEPDWSPDGQQIAFSIRSVSGFTLYSVPSACLSNCADQAVQLTAVGGEDWSPDWSPDGRQIVYVCEQDDHAELCLIDSAGGPARRLTFTAAGVNNLAPAWRPR